MAHASTTIQFQFVADASNVSSSVSSSSCQGASKHVVFVPAVKVAADIDDAIIDPNAPAVDVSKRADGDDEDNDGDDDDCDRSSLDGDREEKEEEEEEEGEEMAIHPLADPRPEVLRSSLKHCTNRPTAYGITGYPITEFDGLVVTKLRCRKSQQKEEQVQQHLHVEADRKTQLLGTVTGIKLPKKEIVGSVDFSSLLKFFNLRVLDLSRNSFSGPHVLLLPEKLEVLRINHNNKFMARVETEKLPPTLTELNARECFDLFGLFDIASLSRLSNLVTCDVSWNKLCGPLPLSCLPPTLRYFNISNNQFGANSATAADKSVLDLSQLPASMVCFDISNNKLGLMYTVSWGQRGDEEDGENKERCVPFPCKMLRSVRMENNCGLVCPAPPKSIAAMLGPAGLSGVSWSANNVSCSLQ